MTDRDRFIGTVQALLTLLLVVAFIYLLILGPGDAADKLKDFVGMAVMFWLMRHRPNGASQDSDEETPAAPAAAPPALEFPRPKSG